MSDVLTKKCNRCWIEKSTLDFQKRSKSKDGLRNQCKECRSEQDKDRCEKNRNRDAIDVPDYKTCPRCNQEKEGSEFYKDNNTLDGLGGWCKECRVKTTNVNQEKNKAREIIIIPDFKRCARCKIEKPSREFYKTWYNKNGLTSWCRDCVSVRNMEKLYGVSEEWYRLTLESQGGACAICNLKFADDNPACVDHEHVEGWKEMPPEKRKLYVRGLLCNNCNFGLGSLKECRKALRRAIDYLKKYGS
jgi:hypothetical protein